MFEFILGSHEFLGNHSFAEFLVGYIFGAALIVHETSSEKQILQRIIAPLLKNLSAGSNEQNELLNQMRDGMRQIAIRDAHLRIVDMLKKYI